VLDPIVEQLNPTSVFVFSMWRLDAA